MHKLIASTALAGIIAAIASTSALAASATATAELNIRSGPGPQYAAVGVIGAGESADVQGCIEGSKWCQVSYNGTTGWAYSDYLTADLSGTAVVLTERRADVGVPVVTFKDNNADGAAAGATTGAIAGALIAGPIGAAVGGAIGATAGATADAVDVPETARTYVTGHPVDPVYLDGEVVVGAGVPDTVTLAEVPDYNYRYAYINGLPVLVDPADRRIIRVIR